MLDQLIEQSRAMDELKTNYGPAVPLGHYGFEGDGDRLSLVVNAELWQDPTTFLGLTDHAARQVCGRLGAAAFPERNKPLPREYLFGACPGYMAAGHLNYWIEELGEQYPTRKWFVRAYEDTCRAVLTDRYATVDVTETLEWVKKALDSKGGGPVTFFNPVVTPDVLHLKVVFQDIDTGNGNGHYGVGGYITTGEIGNRRLGVYPLIQRHSCTNSIVVQKSEFAWEHIHAGRRVLLQRLFVDSIYQVLEGSLESLERLLDAQEREIPSFAEHVEELAKERGWTTVVKNSVLVGTEGQSTLFGLINGVSAAARDMEDAEERVAMELFAGDLLMKKPQGVLVR